jgi:hypothetical protein
MNSRKVKGPRLGSTQLKSPRATSSATIPAVTNEALSSSTSPINSMTRMMRSRG